MKRQFVLFVMLFNFAFAGHTQTYFPYFNGEKWCVYNIHNKETTATTELDSIGAFEHYYYTDGVAAHEFAIGTNKDFKVIINFEGDIVLDSCSSIYYLEPFEGVLHTNFGMNYYLYSQNNETYGIYRPVENRILVPPVYHNIDILVTDDYRKFYQGLDTINQTLTLFNIDNQIEVGSYKAENCSVRYYENGLITKITFRDHTMVVNHSGDTVLPKDTYKSVELNFGTILVDETKEYSFSGEYLGNRENFFNDADVETVMSAGNQEESFERKDNTFTIKSTGEEVTLNSQWNVLNTIENKKELLALISWKGSYGLFDITKNKPATKEEWKFASSFICSTSKSRYPFHENLKTHYSRSVYAVFISVMNKEGKWNIFDVQKRDYVLKQWSEELYNFEYDNFEERIDYFVVANGEEMSIYDILGNEIQSGILDMALTKSRNNFDLKNYTELSKYVYADFQYGWSGYFYIDVSTDKVIPCFPKVLRTEN